jgi:hypothetical protein
MERDRDRSRHGDGDDMERAPQLGLWGPGGYLQTCVMQELEAARVAASEAAAAAAEAAGDAAEPAAAEVTKSAAAEAAAEGAAATWGGRGTGAGGGSVGGGYAVFPPVVAVFATTLWNSDDQVALAADGELAWSGVIGAHAEEIRAMLEAPAGMHEQ